MDFSSFTRESVKVDEVIDCIPVGIAILDLDLRLQAMNRSLEAMTGFSREKATGVG
jgi:PAS domain-containing protein